MRSEMRWDDSVTLYCLIREVSIEVQSELFHNSDNSYFNLDKFQFILIYLNKPPVRSSVRTYVQQFFIYFLFLFVTTEEISHRHHY